MKYKVLAVQSCLALVATLALAGCQESHDSADDDHGHGHSPKYGGVLVELGDHEGNLEFVIDRPSGKLTAYVLDAHAENFVRLPIETFAVEAKVGDAAQTLTFTPVANVATGEKPGDTSQFEATAEWIKTSPGFSAKVVLLPMKEKVYRDVEFSLPNP
jgi:hypothetical protein